MSDSDPTREIEQWRERAARLEQAVASERAKRIEADAQLDGLRAIAVAGTIEALENSLVEALKPLFHHTEGFVLVGEGEGELRSRGATLPDFEGLRFRPGALLRRVLAGAPVAVFDVRAIADWAVQPEAALARMGGALLVPFITSRRRLVLVGTRPERAAFTPADVTLARRFLQTALPVMESLERKEAERARLEADARASALEERQRDLEDQLDMIASQREAIERLTAPVIRLWRGILVVPLAGAVDAADAAVVTERLLQAMVLHKARCAILDVTGVADIGEHMATFLERMVQCVELLGGTCFITGMQPAVAQKLLEVQANLSSFRAFADLEGGLRAAFERLGLGVRASR